MRRKLNFFLFLRRNYRTKKEALTEVKKQRVLFFLAGNCFKIREGNFFSLQTRKVLAKFLDRGLVALVVDTLVNSAIYIFVVLVPLVILGFILRFVFSRLSRGKRDKIVKERLLETEE